MVTSRMLTMTGANGTWDSTKSTMMALHVLVPASTPTSEDLAKQGANLQCQAE